MSNSAATYLHFLWAGLVKQKQTGGVIPSQRFLIAKMIAPVPETYRGQVIELGAGNGALTLRLAARCATRAPRKTPKTEPLGMFTPPQVAERGNSPLAQTFPTEQTGSRFQLVSDGWFTASNLPTPSRE